PPEGEGFGFRFSWLRPKARLFGLTPGSAGHELNGAWLAMPDGGSPGFGFGSRLTAVSTPLSSSAASVWRMHFRTGEKPYRAGICGRSSVVERQLPKLYVVGSIPIARSNMQPSFACSRLCK